MFWIIYLIKKKSSVFDVFKNSKIKVKHQLDRKLKLLDLTVAGTTVVNIQNHARIWTDDKIPPRMRHYCSIYYLGYTIAKWCCRER